MDAETQTEEYDYLLDARPNRYKAPDKDFFDSDKKVRFYTGMPSGEILMVVFEHVTEYINHHTQSLNRFQEFIILLIKLRLNVFFQEFAYRFVVSISTVSRIFLSWMVAMDSRLSPLVSWPDRESLWRTMPISFQYAFGRVTLIIDFSSSETQGQIAVAAVLASDWWQKTCVFLALIRSQNGGDCLELVW